MKILNIRTKNFKVLEDNEFILDGEDFGLVGKNGIGKTSLGEAVNWCMTGNSLSNNSKYTSKYKNNKVKKSAELSVEMLIEHNGEQLFVRREDNPIQAYLDGYESNSLTMEVLGISEEAFLLLFNPRYFSSLSPKDSKALLKKELKRVNIKKIYEQYSDYEKDILEGYTKINKKIDNARNDIRSLEESIIFLEGKRSNLEIKDVPEKKTFDSEEELAARKEMLSNMIDNHEFSETVELKELKKELMRLTSEYEVEKPSVNMALHEIEEKYNLEDLNKKGQAIDEDKKVLQRTLDIKLERIKKEKNKIVNLKDKRRILERENDFLEEKISDSNICPECGYDLNVKNIEKAIENKKSNEIQIEILTKEIETSEKEIKNIQSKVAKVNDAINEVQGNIDEIVLEIKNEKEKMKKEKEEYLNKTQSEDHEFHMKKNKLLHEIDEERDSINRTIREKNKELNQKKVTLREAIHDLEEEKRSVEKHNENIEKIKENNKITKEKIDKVGKDISKEKFKISDLKTKIDLLQKFNAKIVQKQTEELNTALNNVKIEMVKFDKKTGEIKDVFNVEYDNGTDVLDYELCSFGEKQAIGIEIGDMIAKQKDVDIPLFVDDAQSLTIEYLTDRQVIKAITKA